jgi:hypothetical protein
MRHLLLSLRLNQIVLLRLCPKVQQLTDAFPTVLIRDIALFLQPFALLLIEPMPPPGVILSLIDDLTGHGMRCDLGEKRPSNIIRVFGILP